MFINDSCQLLYDLSGVLSQALDLKRTFRKGQVRGCIQVCSFKDIRCCIPTVIELSFGEVGNTRLEACGIFSSPASD